MTVIFMEMILLSNFLASSNEKRPICLKLLSKWFLVFNFGPPNLGKFEFWLWPAVGIFRITYLCNNLQTQMPFKFSVFKLFGFCNVKTIWIHKRLFSLNL